jgi:hypothetical protein
LERIVIQKQGSFLYTRGWRKLVTAVVLVYVVFGTALAISAAIILDSLMLGITIFACSMAAVAAMCMLYIGAMWFFEWESHQAVEISDDGIREIRSGRERAFIPWAGVRVIEMNATIVAGGTLRVKGDFSEIAISNVDLAIKQPMSIKDMHASLGQVRLMLDILRTLRKNAPQARFQMNRLACRRLKKYGLPESQ